MYKKYKTMYKKGLCVIMAMVFCCMALQAETAETRLLSLNKKNTTLVAPFTEKKVLPKLKKETKKEGQLYFASPDALSMRYSDPDGDVTLIKDGSFSVRRNGKVQKFSMKSENSQMRLLRDILLYSFRGDIQGVATRCNASIESSESATQYSFTITKKDKVKVGVCIIKLVYDKKTGAIVSLCLEELNGNYTIYETSHAACNKTIPSDVWVIE